MGCGVVTLELCGFKTMQGLIERVSYCLPPALIKTLVGYTCRPRGFGFSYGLGSCIVDVGLPLCPRVVCVFRGKL